MNDNKTSSHTEIFKDLYTILGLDKDCSEEDIKKAFKDRAKKLHPDATANQQEYEEFLELKLAYDILGNKQKRLVYNTTGKIPGNEYIDDLEVKAISEIIRILDSKLDELGDNIFFTNLPKEIIELIDANIKQSKTTIEDSKKSINRLRKFRKHFIYKNKKSKSNFIDIGIKSRIIDYKQTIQTNLDKIRLFNKILELLTDYDYILDQAFNVTLNNATNTNTSSNI